MLAQNPTFNASVINPCTFGKLTDNQFKVISIAIYLEVRMV